MVYMYADNLIPHISDMICADVELSMLFQMSKTLVKGD